MVDCYTSTTAVKRNVKKLLEVQDAVTKLKSYQESLVIENSRKVRREKRTKNSSCATYIQEITSYEKVSQMFS